MDQTNPLSEITHKRRLSALGPGGLSRERAGFEVRDVHPTHYGRICPIETPEGPNIGLISSLSCYARINEFGFIEIAVPEGRRTAASLDYVIVTNAAGTQLQGSATSSRPTSWCRENGRARRRSGVEVEPYSFYLSAWEEDKYIIAQANAAVGRRRQPDAGPRQRAARPATSSSRRARTVQFIDVSPEAARLGRGVADPVPRERRRQPRADGLEHAAPGGAAAPRRGRRSSAPAWSTSRRATPAPSIVAKRVGHRRLRSTRSASSCASRARTRDRRAQQGDRRRHLPDDQVQALQPEHLHHPEADRPGRAAGAQGRRCWPTARAPSTASWRSGRNVLVAFMPWRGYNFEDAILVSERMVKDDYYTSIHIEEFEIEARDTKLGPEEITRDIPNVSESAPEGPRRERHHPHRRQRQAGRHPGRQGHAEGRDPADAGGEAAARDLRREGRRRPRRQPRSARPASRASIVGVKIFSRKGIEKDDRAQGDRAGRARHDGEEPAGRDPHPPRGGARSGSSIMLRRPAAAVGPGRRARPRAAAQEGHRSERRRSCRRCPTSDGAAEDRDRRLEARGRPAGSRGARPSARSR